LRVPTQNPASVCQSLPRRGFDFSHHPSAPTRLVVRRKADGLVICPEWSAGADDQLTNAGACRLVRCPSMHKETKKAPGVPGLHARLEELLGRLDSIPKREMR